VTAGGNTLFERIATRLPGATLCQLELQMKIADAFEKMGVNVNLGLGASLGPDEMARKLDNFLKDFDGHRHQYQKAAGVIDGHGLDHFVQAIEEVREERGK
jgi:spore coat polysaccharide biosynthesis predicted glycosyltransferase SpsG